MFLGVRQRCRGQKSVAALAAQLGGCLAGGCLAPLTHCRVTLLSLITLLLIPMCGVRPTTTDNHYYET
ncbi:hypothetical protein BHM03_00056381 [Ensete ventricosum]|nr:hypothetical protein BHM03_00056381 [Ensete ventricosum]